MTKVTIYLSIVEKDGKKHLHLRDSNGNSGDDTIVTEANRDDTILWKKDTGSGLKSITEIKVNKSSELFSKGPKKRCCSRWKGWVSSQASKGDYAYVPYYVESNPDKSDTPQKQINGDPPPPVIKIKD